MKTRSAIVWMLCCIGFALAATTSAHRSAHAGPGSFKVIFFLDPECPVSNAYMREIKSIHSDYAKRGVAFEAVFPVPTVNREDIRQFLLKYQATIPGYQDAGLQKVKRYQATTMPEAVLVNANGEILYRGAIDNWYYALGKNRAKATELYLRNAIEAVLNGEMVVKSRTEAIGCLINQ
ncbi:AhpC/TSA family protein [Dyadobacter soli]|uniref:AhpC/TSA family protein n=1 Tax=Dyadobacter soli TaxID=659014 RepID=A0A1G7U629_9BACT|nr:redoxin domain-containing protein [Dyadobacter soli]SDG43102.1 AhpC/TSA family protein [Dyadobacter soli]